MLQQVNIHFLSQRTLAISVKLDNCSGVRRRFRKMANCSVAGLDSAVQDHSLDAGLWGALMCWVGPGLCYVLCFCAMSPSLQVAVTLFPFTGWVALRLPEWGLWNVQETDTQAREHTENRQKWDKDRSSQQATSQMNHKIPHNELCSDLFCNTALLFPDYVSKYLWWQVIQRQSWLWRVLKPIWRVCVHGSIYDSALRRWEMLWGAELRQLKPEQSHTINCSILFCQDWIKSQAARSRGKLPGGKSPEKSSRSLFLSKDSTVWHSMKTLR